MGPSAFFARFPRLIIDCASLLLTPQHALLLNALLPQALKIAIATGAQHEYTNKNKLTVLGKCIDLVARPSEAQKLLQRKYSSLSHKG